MNRDDKTLAQLLAGLGLRSSSAEEPTFEAAPSLAHDTARGFARGEAPSLDELDELQPTPLDLPAAKAAGFEVTRFAERPSAWEFVHTSQVLPQITPAPPEGAMVLDDEGFVILDLDVFEAPMVVLHSPESSACLVLRRGEGDIEVGHVDVTEEDLGVPAVPLEHFFSESDDDALLDELRALACTGGALGRLVAAGAFARHELLTRPEDRREMLAAMLAGRLPEADAARAWAAELSEEDAAALSHQAVMRASQLERELTEHGAEVERLAVFSLEREDLESLRALLRAAQHADPLEEVLRRCDARIKQLVAEEHLDEIRFHTSAERLMRATVQYPEAWWVTGVTLD